jgi:hypothetical protein
MIMCHMVADTLDELFKMADRIGVSSRWFQAKSVLPHFDICLAKRATAIRLGAIEIGRKELVARIRAARTERT